MNSRTACAKLRKLGALVVVRTSDAAAALGQSTSAAAKTLTRLAEAGLVDPTAQPLEAYTLGDSARWREVRHCRADDRARIAPFEAIEPDLSLLSSSPRRT